MSVVHIYEPEPVTRYINPGQRVNTLSSRTRPAKRRTCDDITPHIILVIAGFIAILAYYTFT